MSHERLSDNDSKEYTTLSNHNLLGLGGVMAGSEWTSTIKDECLVVTYQPTEQGKFGSTQGIVLMGTLATLALLGAATLTQAPLTSVTRHENVTVIPAE